MRVVVSSLALLTLSVGLASANPRGNVIGSGGGTSSGGGLVLVGTVGQAAVGVSSGASNRVCHGFWCFGGSRVLAVDPPGGAQLPAEFALGPSTPNPTRDEAHFHLALPRAATVSLTVYDVSGRQVGDVLSHRFGAGEHDLYWRAPGAQAGVYFLRLATDGVVRAKRTIVVAR
jgi:hypothetical protein